MKYGLAACVCFTASVTAGVTQAVPRGRDVIAGCVGSRDSETCCDSNCIADADEMKPLSWVALFFDRSGDYVGPGASTTLTELGQGDFRLEPSYAAGSS